MNCEMIQSLIMRIAIVLSLFTTTLGCVKRSLTLTTTPPNALVWLNDREVGRTPVSVDFLYYGEYDIRIEHGDSESIMTSRWLKAPWWDMPFVDIAAEIMPFQVNSSPSWHFDLQPRNDNQELLIDRANAFRLRESGDQE